jgi:hypothetical protein
MVALFEKVDKYVRGYELLAVQDFRFSIDWVPAIVRIDG